MNELQLLIEMVIRMITNNEKHEDYDRVCNLAKEYRALSTGAGVDEFLRRFVKRESEEDFKMRCDITQAITPAIASSIAKPFYKVVRNDRVKKGLDVLDEKKKEKIEKIIDSFYGSTRSEKKGLGYWMKTRKFYLSFIDPNAWVVIDWAPVTKSQVPKPYPLEILSDEAINFEVINDEVQWLLTLFKTKYQFGKDKKLPLKDGEKYTLYHQNYTIIFDEVDITLYQGASGIELMPNQHIEELSKGKNYLVSVFQPKIGYAPAFRIGYKLDAETDGRTFVIPWHDAMPYFQKSLKTVSELDLTIAGHVFPQKIQFAPPCPGGGQNERCNKGVNINGGTCSVCKGSGYLTHTASNDVIFLPMPELDAEKPGVFNLDNILVYKSPPMDLVKFQKEYVDWLEEKAHNAVFNSQMFVKKSSGVSGDGVKTAFEIDTNLQSVYDTLEPYTEKESDLYKEIVRVICILCGVKPENISVTHIFPSDFKLKTIDMLLVDLKSVNESEAPAFLRDAVNLDIAEKVFEGDPVGLLKYRVKRKFFPFNGKNPDEIALLLTSQFVSNREKVLYSNFDSIFMEIEADHSEFYTMTYEQQLDIVNEFIDYWTEDIETAPAMSVDALRQAATESEDLTDDEEAQE